LKKALVVIAVISLVFAAVPAMAGPPANAGADKVVICHETASQTNPYVIIEIARKAWDRGHDPNHADINLTDLYGITDRAEANLDYCFGGGG
jgi:hypothetical protein